MENVIHVANITAEGEVANSMCGQPVGTTPLIGRTMLPVSSVCRHCVRLAVHRHVGQVTEMLK